MRFALAPGYIVAEVAAGQHLYRLDESAPVLSTWEPDAIASMLGRPGIEVVQEKAEDVVRELPALSDRELKAVQAYDRRPTVAKAVEDELERRAAARLAEFSETEPAAGEED